MECVKKKELVWYVQNIFILCDMINKRDTWMKGAMDNENEAYYDGYIADGNGFCGI